MSQRKIAKGNLICRVCALEDNRVTDMGPVYTREQINKMLFYDRLGYMNDQAHGVCWRCRSRRPETFDKLIKEMQNEIKKKQEKIVHLYILKDRHEFKR